jgi:hypothetical protein
MDSSIIGWILFGITAVIFIGREAMRSRYGSAGSASLGLNMNVFSGIAPLINIIPIGLFAGGPFSDFLHGETKLGIPSYGVLIALAFFKGLTKILQNTGFLPEFTKGPLANDTSIFWCTLPGFEWLENPLFPSSVFASITIVAYFLYWAKIGSSQYNTIGIFMAFVLVSNIIGFTFGQCAGYYRNMFPSLYSFGVLAPTCLVSFAVAGIIFSAVYTDQSKNPLTSLGGGGGDPLVIHGDTPNSSNGGSGGYNTTCPAGQLRTEKQFCIPCDSTTSYVVGETCVPKDSSNQTPADNGLGQLVEVKAYKNGVEVTDVLSK